MKFNLFLHLKVRVSPPKKLPILCFICFNESPLKIMRNASYFILQALYILKIFKFLPWLFGNEEKTIPIRKIRLISKFMATWLTNNYNTRIVQYFTN